MSLLDAILMPRTVVETLAMQAEKRTVLVLPIFPEDLEKYYDSGKLVVRSDGSTYRLGLTPEERKEKRRERNRKWLLNPEVKAKQLVKNRERQRKLAARRRADRLALASTSSQASSTTETTKPAQP